VNRQFGIDKELHMHTAQVTCSELYSLDNGLNANFVYRQTGVRGFQNVDYFLPPAVMGHVTRRMRSDHYT